MKNTKAFIQEYMLPPDIYKLISFDVKPLFSNVPLDYTIDIILKRIYDQKELETKVLQKEMKDFLLLPKTYILLMMINCTLKRIVPQ